MMPLPFSRRQMVREASLTEADLAEIAKCRRDHNRLGVIVQSSCISWRRAYLRSP
jgi:hypothetical protein